MIINLEVMVDFQDIRRKSIALVTLYRAGSTFMGELFNQNEDVFYHFEPLTMFGYDKPNLEVKLKFLKEVLIDCRSPTYRYKGFEDVSTENEIQKKSMKF